MLDIEYIAKKLASDDLNSTHLYETKPDDFYVVWKCKTLQNWKAVVSTDISKYNLRTDIGAYDLQCGYLWEITYNGDKKEYYIDRYQKSSNKCVKEE